MSLGSPLNSRVEALFPQKTAHSPVCRFETNVGRLVDTTKHLGTEGSLSHAECEEESERQKQAGAEQSAGRVDCDLKRERYEMRLNYYP